MQGDPARMALSLNATGRCRHQLGQLSIGFAETVLGKADLFAQSELLDDPSHKVRRLLQMETHGLARRIRLSG